MLPLIRLYPLVAGAGTLVASVTMVVGLIGVPLEMLGLTIGRYAALEPGGGTQFALVLLVLSSLGLLAGMRAVRAPVSGWPERLVLAWAAALAVAAVVPGTPVADLMVAVALVNLAGAAALMARRFGDDERWQPVARPLEWLALGAGGALAVLTYVALPGHQVMIGLVEWSLLGIEVAVLAVSAVQLARIMWSPTAEPVAVTAAVLRNRVPAPVRTPVVTPAMTAGMTMAMAVTPAMRNPTSNARRPTALLGRH